MFVQANLHLFRCLTFALVALVVVATTSLPSFAQSQGTGIGGGGSTGGGTTTATITSDVPEDGKVIIGIVLSFSFTATGGTAPHTGVWEVTCGDDDTPVGAAVPDTPFVCCVFDKEGEYEVTVTVSDAVGATDDDTIMFEVLGPNGFEPDLSDESNPSTSTGTVMTLEHKFFGQVDGENVGICWDETCVYKFKSEKTENGEWESGPPEDINDWDDHERGQESCSDDPARAFFGIVLSSI